MVSKLLLCLQMGKLRYRGEAPQSVTEAGIRLPIMELSWGAHWMLASSSNLTVALMGLSSS